MGKGKALLDLSSTTRSRPASGKVLVGLFSYLGDSDLINVPVVKNVCRVGNWI